MAPKAPITSEYADALNEIKKRVKAAQYEALKSVNRELIALYWDIGGIIVTRQLSADWGRSVVEQLAGDLQREFPGVSGFSASNLWRMRNFYTTYASDKKLAPMVREIGWSHNVMIMERCQNSQQREFYIRMILCREKKRTIVEYTLKESNKPIGVAAYRIVRRLPAELKGKLPDPKQIERLLEACGGAQGTEW